MKQSKTTIKELTKRYRAVLLKCALMNMAAFVIGIPSAFATDFTIGENDTATYTRIPGEGISRYNLTINGEQQVLSSSDRLTMTGGSLTFGSDPVNNWLDWQGDGGITISGGTVSAQHVETLSGYRSGIAISGTADIRTALSSESNMTISGGTVNLSGIQNPEPGLYFSEAMGIMAAEEEETSGSLNISGGTITLNQNRQLAVVREWNSEDGSDPDSYNGNINISGGTITLNDNAQIIRTDVDYAIEGGRFLKDFAPEELDKTTGGITISGGEVNLNGTAKIINHSNDGTITISNTAVVNVNGTNAFEDATGTATATLSGGTLNVKGRLTANIIATGGALTFATSNAALNGTLTGSLASLNISGGRFEDKAFHVLGEATISGGTFTDESEFFDGSFTVSGGTFQDSVTFNGSSLTFSGGTFNNTDKFDAKASTNIEISGREFNVDIMDFKAGNNITINSDNVALNRVSDHFPLAFKAGATISITGDEGLSVQKTTMEAPTVSGKIAAGNQSFIGRFGNSANKWSDDGNTLYSVFPDNFGGNATFDNATLTLSGNAVAGTGNYMWDVSGSDDENITNVDIKSAPLTLDEQQINDSVSWIMTEIGNINSSDNKSTDALTVAVNDAIEVPWINGSYDEVQDFIESKWEYGTALTEEELANVATALRTAYSSYSDSVNAFSANVTVTDSTIAMNDTAALANYSIADDEKGNITVNNSTVTVNGTNTISAAEGDISFTNASTLAVGNGATSNIVSKNNNTVAFDNTSTLDLAGRLNGNVSVNNSTILFKNGATLNGTLTGTIGTLNISGGTFENQEFTVSGDATISGGTFSKDAYIVSSNTIAISGGALFTPGTGFETELEANDITVSGGTFNGAMDWEADNNMTISGGTFNSSRIEFEAGNTLEIDSDGVSLTRTTGTTPFIFKAGTQINVTGTTGLATTETVVASSLISGKIIANNQSFIGNVGNAVNKWTFGNNTVYSVTPDAFGTDTAFNEANLTLNGNAIAGSGNYIWEIAGSGASDITAVSLTPVQNKLTADEINNSVTLTMAEIRRINSSQTKNSDDMLDVYEDVWDDIPWPASSYGLQDFVIGKWESGTALTEDELDDVEDVLRAVYSSYNTALNTYSADVTVTNSTITMNGTSALANYSIADDEKGNITVDHSTVTANGTNTISASKGEISFENNSALTVSNGAVLSIVSKNDNTVSFDATSGLNVNGTVNGNIAFAGANGKVKANNGTVRGTLSVAENTVLDMSGNSQIDALNVDKLISANGKLAIDIDAARKVADTLTVGAESSGTLTISALNGIQAGQDFSVEVLKGAGVGNITLALSDELTAEYGSEQERHETRTENLKADSAWTDTYGAFDWIITEEQQLAVNGGKVTYSSSVTEQKGEALDTQDTLMLVNTNATLSAKSFKTTDAQAEYAATADLGETKGAVTVSGAKDGNAVSTIALGNHSGFIVNSGATLKLDSVRITGDNGVLTVGSGATVSLNNIVLEGSVTNNGTLDIGESTLVATNISGGILKATLTDAAKTSAIVTADAENVTLALDMSKAARGDEATLYHVTDGTGFTFGEYDTRRYAVSTASFDKNAAKEMAVLGNWTGGDLYIMKLATAGEAAVEDLKNIGVPVSANEEKAIAALNDEVIEKLAPSQKAAVQKINDLLDTLAGNVAQIKQVLREVAPEAAPSASQTASSNAGAVISVVGTRMGGGSPAPAAGSGRSGGDYTAGAGSVWAQGMYNKAKLDKTDDFDSNSTGFAAGFEYAFNDSVKAGIGYAYTTTDIDTDRSKTDVDTHTGFVYGEYKPDNFYVNSVLSYGHSKYDETTRLAGLKSDYRANTFAGQIMSGYTFGFLTPEAGLRYTSVRQRSYTNALGAQMASKTLDTWTGVAGLKASKSFRSGKTTITPDAKLALTYDFKRDGQARTVTLANGSSYVAEGDNMKRFGVELGAGVSVKVGNNTDIGLSYEGKFKDHYTDHTGLINVKYNF